MENINEMGHSFTKEEILRWLNEQPISHHYTLIEITNIVDTLYTGTPFVEHTDEDGHVYYYSDDCDVMLKYQIECMYNCLFDLKHSNELLNSRNGLIAFEKISEAIQTREEAYNKMKEYVNKLWPDIVKEPRRAKQSPFLMIEGLPTIRGTQRESQAFNEAITRGYMRLNTDGNCYSWEGVGPKGKIAQFAYFMVLLYRDEKQCMPQKDIMNLFPKVTKRLQDAIRRLDSAKNTQQWEESIKELVSNSDYKR